MLLLLHDFGFPHAHGQTFIFNGDWVDRGKNQLEVVCLVFAYKVAFPQNVKLNRGNHEDAVMNTGERGFRAVCENRFGPRKGAEVYRAFIDAFDWLPLGCVVAGRILILHGGIGDGNWELNHLDNVQRPLTTHSLPADRIVYNMLWSDPIPETQLDSFGVHGSPRDNHAHLICRFGRDVTKQFLERNGLDMIIRSHEARVKGHGYEVLHEGKCVRVFSARDYEHNHNDACVLSIRRRNPHFGETILIRPQVLRSIERPLLAGETQEHLGMSGSMFDCSNGNSYSSTDDETGSSDGSDHEIKSA